MGWLYLLTFPNGKGYVGQTRGPIARRIAGHARDAERRDSALYRAWRKYGAPYVMPLGECPDDQLSVREVELIAALGTYGAHGYNATPGGEESPTLVPAIARRSADGRRGQKRTAEAKERMAAAKRGRRLSPGTRAKMSEARRRFIAQHPEVRAQVSATHTGRKRSAETRARLSAAARARCAP